MTPPHAEVTIDEDIVRALLKTQHPDLADLFLVDAGEGWDISRVFCTRSISRRHPAYQ